MEDEILDERSLPTVIIAGVLSFVAAVLLAVIGLLKTLALIVLPASRGFSRYFGPTALGALCVFIGWQTGFTPHENFWWLIAAMGLFALQAVVYRHFGFAFGLAALALLCALANNLLTAHSIDVTTHAIANAFGPLSGQGALLGALTVFAIAAAVVLYGAAAAFRDTAGFITNQAPGEK